MLIDVNLCHLDFLLSFIIVHQRGQSASLSQNDDLIVLLLMTKLL